MTFDDAEGYEDARAEQIMPANPNGAPSGDEGDGEKKKPMSFLTKMLEDAKKAESDDYSMGNKQHLETMSDA